MGDGLFRTTLSDGNPATSVKEIRRRPARPTELRSSRKKFRRRNPVESLEHGDEGTDGLVAKRQCHRGNALPRCQPIDGMLGNHPPPPFEKRQAGFVLKMPRER